MTRELRNVCCYASLFASCLMGCGCVSASSDRPLTQMVELDSSPAGALILVDGQPKGVTPRKQELTKAMHRVELVKEGYTKYDTYIAPEPKGLLEHVYTFGFAFWDSDSFKSKYLFELVPVTK